MGSDALQQGQCITHTIRGGRRELGRVQERIDGDDFLDERGHDS